MDPGWNMNQPAVPHTTPSKPVMNRNTFCQRPAVASDAISPSEERQLSQMRTADTSAMQASHAAMAMWLISGQKATAARDAAQITAMSVQRPNLRSAFTRASWTCWSKEMTFRTGFSAAMLSCLTPEACQTCRPPTIDRSRHIMYLHYVISKHELFVAKQFCAQTI